VKGGRNYKQQTHEEEHEVPDRLLCRKWAVTRSVESIRIGSLHARHFVTNNGGKEKDACVRAFGTEINASSDIPK